MVHQRDINHLAMAIQELPEGMTACEQVARALIETGQAWAYPSEFRMVFFGTDYGRAREQVQQTCRTALATARRVRHGMLSADAIRASSYLEKIIKHCDECPDANKARLADGKPITCLVLAWLREHSTDAFRFSLDKEGRVIERR